MESSKSVLKKIFLISTTIALIGGGCSSAPAPTVEVTLAPGFAWYENKEAGFSIQYPTAWEKKENENKNAPVQFLSPAENATDLFRENINIIVGEKPPQNLSFDDILGSLESNIKNFKLEAKTTETIAMGEAKTVVYITNLTNGDKTYDLKIRQTYVRGKNNFYVITYTSEAANYAKFTADADTMIRSFKSN